MKKRFISLFFFFLYCIPDSTAELQTGVPEAEGVSSQAILDFLEAAEKDIDALHSFVLLRHGRIISEGWWAPYAKGKPHMLYSLSKSFTSTAIGIAVEEGRLGLDDKVVSFFPDQVPNEASENLKSMRIRDLLCMGTGHHHDTLPPMKDGTETDWIKVFLSQPVEHEPGTHFRYNTGATYMLSAILQKVTGQKLLDYLTPRLFDPLGIQNPTWEISPQGINTGGYGLKVTTTDIAKLGQLYLQKGLWNGQRLLSKKWVETATEKHISNGHNPNSDWNQGYGFQFWRCRHNAYRGDGAFGQYCIVLPEQDAVLAMTGGLGNMQQVLNLVWTHLLPAMKTQALEPDPSTQEALVKKTNSLRLAPPIQEEVASPVAQSHYGKTFHFEENDKGFKSLTLHPTYLLIDNAHGEQRIDLGAEKWRPGHIVFEKNLLQPVGGTNGRQSIAIRSGWTRSDQYVVRMIFDETPFHLDLNLLFKDGKLILELEYNVAFGKRKWQLIGRLKD